MATQILFVHSTQKQKEVRAHWDIHIDARTLTDVKINKFDLKGKIGYIETQLLSGHIFISTFNTEVYHFLNILHVSFNASHS